MFAPSAVEWQPAPKFQDRRWLHVLLLVFTIGSTTLAGMGHYLGFLGDFGNRLPAGLSTPAIDRRRALVQRHDPVDPGMPRTGSLFRLPLL